MKKKLGLVTFCLLNAAMVNADETPPLCCKMPYENCNRDILEFRLSYFRPSSELLRKIYNSGGINYELTASFPVWQGLNIWTAVDYFSKNGPLCSWAIKRRISASFHSRSD